MAEHFVAASSLLTSTNVVSAVTLNVKRPVVTMLQEQSLSFLQDVTTNNKPETATKKNNFFIQCYFFKLDE
jgi:hypothetical protein